MAIIGIDLGTSNSAAAVLRGGRPVIIPSGEGIRPCPKCAGRGQFIDHPCAECRGTGTRHIEESLQVEIPIGAEEGMALRIPGRGYPGPPKSPPGDLLVVLRTSADPRFIRRGKNLCGDPKPLKSLTRCSVHPVNCRLWTVVSRSRFHRALSRTRFCGPVEKVFPHSETVPVAIYSFRFRFEFPNNFRATQGNCTNN